MPFSLGSQSLNIGRNSVSSNSSAPIAGQPKAIAEKSSTKSAENSLAVNNLASPPLELTPSTIVLAIFSVLPVPLQNTTAIFFIIKIPPKNLYSNGQTLNRSSLIEQSFIDISTFFKPFERFKSLGFIVIYFPISTTLTIFSTIIYKTYNV